MSPRGRRPRRIGAAVGEAVAEAAPATLLAAVQSSWRSACGNEVAARAQPVAERDGVVVVACATSTWAQELDLIQDEIRARLNAELGGERVARLRFTADAARHRAFCA